MILFKVFVLSLPALVDGHGFMSMPVPRTGFDEATNLKSPKLGPWEGYRAEIDKDETGCYGPPNASPGGKNGEKALRGQFATNRMQVTPGVPFMVEWDIRLAHAAPLNHLRIAYRTFTYNAAANPTSTTTSQFENGVLFNKEDTAEDRAALQSPTFANYLSTGKHSTMVTIPTDATPGLAELQWVWASERDGPGGYYISCADIEILEVNAGTPPPTPAPTLPPSQGGMGNSLMCYEGKGALRQETACQAPLNDRCMTTWVNGEYYYRCANAAFCVSAQASAENEGKSNGEVFSSALTSLQCCSVDRCNVEKLVSLPPGINTSVKPIITLGVIFGLVHLFL